MPSRSKFRLFADKQLALMLALGFSSGLPFLLVFSTQSAWLREAGVAKEHIGLMSWVALAYSFKFLWAPLLDRYDAPLLGRWLGRRRGWMALTQIGVALPRRPRFWRPGQQSALHHHFRLLPRLLRGDAGCRDRRLAHRNRPARTAGRNVGGEPGRL